MSITPGRAVRNNGEYGLIKRAGKRADRVVRPYGSRNKKRAITKQMLIIAPAVAE
jgi:hypothetical protein